MPDRIYSMVTRKTAFLYSLFFLLGSTLFGQVSREPVSGQPVYEDVSFIQDYAVKYTLPGPYGNLRNVYTDRNGNVRILFSGGILQPDQGAFLQSGQLVPDRTYLPMRDMKIAGLSIYESQFVYLDDQSVFSNAWAGSYRILHNLPGSTLLGMGKNLECLVSDGSSLEFLTKDKAPLRVTIAAPVLDIQHDIRQDQYYILASDGIYSYRPGTKVASRIISGEGFTAFALSDGKIIAGTSNGYEEYDLPSGNRIGDRKVKLPSPDITAISVIDGHLWFGSREGAFMLRQDGRYNFYNGERWLPDNQVRHIAAGPDQSVLILTSSGLSQIVFREITLYDKAVYFEKQVRQRHIRHGFNADLGQMHKGDPESGILRDSDNDGLWTSMYLAGQAFRYAATGSADALQNCEESMDAMERLYTINPVPGFPSRSFERHGYKEKLADPERWQHAPDPHWDWKATTSSDEAIGHIFAFGVVAELVDQPKLKEQAIRLIDTLMSHIVSNNWYLIDYDGRHTTWGRWHPDYVNGFPEVVGDRKLNSSNIIGMLQTAYHFTGKEKYQTSALELMYQHGYLKNLMRPVNQIGRAPDHADEWSKMLSESWNHSDDEMYFVGYWGLYRYAFNDELKQQYKAAIIDHWEAERPEKEGLWNIITAITGIPDFDLDEAVWYLQEHPLDLIDWNIVNSNRRDIIFLEENFREQTTEEVLPPDERPVQRHNSNMFRLDQRGTNGLSERSAGDIWLLPYWMGRYLGIISQPSVTSAIQVFSW